MTANFSYIYQWLLSNKSDFITCTQQVIEKERNHEQHMKSAQSYLEMHANNFFIVNVQQISH